MTPLPSAMETPLTPRCSQEQFWSYQIETQDGRAGQVSDRSPLNATVRKKKAFHWQRVTVELRMQVLASQMSEF